MRQELNHKLEDVLFERNGLQWHLDLTTSQLLGGLQLIDSGS